MGKVRTTIYVSPELWKKFKEYTARDRYKMSNLIEEFIREWVHEHGGINPQRPLTAYVEGHPDEEKLQEQQLYAWLREFAMERRVEIRYKTIVQTLREAQVPRARINALAKDIAARLKKDDITVLY